MNKRDHRNGRASKVVGWSARSKARNPKAAHASRERPRANAAVHPPSAATAFPIVGIGASAGGLEAFTELLKHLPLDTGMGFVLVQHLDPVRHSALTELLAKATRLPVREVTRNAPVQPNRVYVIAPNTNLTIAQGVLKLRPRQKISGAQRSVDLFFESLAQDQHERAIGVILSGAASDGTLGLEMIKGKGGITFAQDDSARYDSMPRSAVAAGCVDFVLSPAKIAKELASIAKHPYVAGQPKSISAEEDRDPRRRTRTMKLCCLWAGPALRARERSRRAPKRKRQAPPREKTASKKFSFSCATIRGWISRSTNRTPFGGASTGAWC
jgi:chemotaxis response regulator CheB